MSERTLDGPPGTLGLYGRAALGSVPLAGTLAVRGGRRRRDAGLPSSCSRTSASTRSASPSTADVCGFTMRDALPATYPHILAFPLHMALMTQGDFPLPGGRPRPRPEPDRAAPADRGDREARDPSQRGRAQAPPEGQDLRAPHLGQLGRRGGLGLREHEPAPRQGLRVGERLGPIVRSRSRAPRPSGRCRAIWAEATAASRATAIRSTCTG